MPIRNFTLRIVSDADAHQIPVNDRRPQTERPKRIRLFPLAAMRVKLGNSARYV